MSSKDSEKRKAANDNDNSAATAPASKRQKVIDTMHSDSSLLLETQPEILRKIYSFLSLKESVVLRQVHRQFNESSNDLYQYSFTMNSKSVMNGAIDYDYLIRQERGLCNLVDKENLRAVLRNETLPSDLAEIFMDYFVEYSETDNGQAVPILLEDGRCEVDASQLEKCLRKGLTAMAAVLQQDERVKKDIVMCPTCSNDNIGCYYCTNYKECVMGEEQGYCRDCALKDNRFCKMCNHYLCPSCFEDGLFCSCEKCGDIECLHEDCRGKLLIECQYCDREKCEACIEVDREHWREIYGVRGVGLACPSCQNGGWVGGNEELMDY